MPMIGTKRMQRWLGIAFFALFGYALVGIYPVRSVLREMAQHDMKAFIRDGGGQSPAVTDLSFTLKNGEVADARFAWEEDDEFMFDGAMYDVVGREVHGIVVTFHCISDQRETKLAAQANAIDQVNGPAQTPQTNSKALAKFVSGKYLRENAVAMNASTPIDIGFGPVQGTTTSGGHVRHSAPPPRG
jgi:hypothetical protein